MQIFLKILCLMLIVIVALEGVCTQADDDMKSVSKRERTLDIHSDILDESYELFAVQELRMPLAEHAYLVAKKSGEFYIIRSSAEFSRVVKAIHTADDALELSRLITSQELRPFLQDVFYVEVDKTLDTENNDSFLEQCFRLDAESYDVFKLHPPVVKEDKGVFTIERFVASYPRKEEGRENILPAQLLKILEQIDSEGNYRMEILEILTEGEEIHKILLFTK